MTAPLFGDRHMVVAMQKLHAAMDVTCNCVGDVCLGEHSLSVNVAEIDAGLPLRWVKEDLECFGNPLTHIELLEEKELVTRIRNASDRRGFALKATPKGKARLALVDEAIAAMLISANKRWSEAEFEYLVAKTHALPSIYTAKRRTSTIFPGTFLSLVYRYHQIMVRTAAYYGMTSLQGAVLCAFEGAGAVLLSHHVELLSGIPESVNDFLMDDLAEKGLIRNDDSFELTEKGFQRVEEFTRRISFQMGILFANHSEKDTELFEELGEYCIYLLA